VVYGDEQPICQRGPGNLRQYLVSRATGATAVSVVTSEWQPGFQARPHQHADEEVMLFLDGTAEGEVDGEPVTVRPGTVVIVPPHTTHWLRNAGPTPLRQVVIYGSPAYERPAQGCPPTADRRVLACLPPGPG
jgi:mannose-6-phosphate isomerase-like protein (cupin superfamily)